MEKIDAKINNLIKKCDSLGANATKAGRGTDKLSDACTKLKDRAEAGSAGTQKLSGSLKVLKAGAAVAAITAVTKAVKRLTDAYAETQAAQVGLESILAAQGKDVSQAKAWLQEYTKDGLIPLADAYTAYKNLSSAGYADDQTQSVLQNLKDSAAFAGRGRSRWARRSNLRRKALRTRTVSWSIMLALQRTSPSSGKNMLRPLGRAWGASQRPKNALPR